jgi:hypothetical protein
MKLIIFNREILEALIRCGFRYCYSKTVADEQLAGQVSIFLTPVSLVPNIRNLPSRYDTYYDLAEEPGQMAMGIDEDTAVFINLDDTLLKECYEQDYFDHRQ